MNMNDGASARLVGVMTTADSARDDHVPPAQHETSAFAGGFVSHRAGLQPYRSPQGICFSLGEPRFADPELAATASELGAGAAWLEAFQQDGNEAPNRVRGRFSVVIVRPQAHEVWMATDRFATWPICYSVQDGQLFFADRADAVPVPRRTLSRQAIFEYLYFHMIPAPATIFEGVRRLPAGHLLHWCDGDSEETRWWNPRFDESNRPDLDESKQQFLSIVERAVAREADGHVAACFLSGGTDSSTIAGMLCKVLGRPAAGYSIGFDAEGYDEMEYARIAARHFGVDHHEHYVTPGDLRDGIPRVAAHYDQPFGNSSAVPAWICANHARADGVRKMLAGDGGDELFGGNTRYAKQRVFAWYENVPGILRKGALEPVLGLPGMDRLPIVKKGVSYVEQASVPMPDRMQMYNMLERLGLTTVFDPDFLAGVDTSQVRAQQRDTWGSTSARSLTNRMLAFDWKYTLADNDLPKVIGTTDLAGLDVGFPFLSDELLEFSLSVPPEWKLKGLTLRWFFKEALRGFLPDAIIAKKKHGFGLPFGVWACRDPNLKSLAEEALNSFGERGIVRREFIHELLTRHLPAHPGYYGEMAWILMMLELWIQAQALDG